MRRTPVVGLGFLVVYVVAILLLSAAVVAGAAAITLAVAGGDDDPATTARESPADGRADEEGEEESEGESVSLLSVAGMRAALRAIEDAGDGRPVHLLRVARDQITANLQGKLVVFREDGTVTVLDAPGPSTNTFDLDDVNPRAPRRIDRGLARRRDGRLDYAVLMSNPIDGELRWSAFVDGGRTGFSAEPDGSGLCPLGSQC